MILNMKNKVSFG